MGISSLVSMGRRKSARRRSWTLCAFVCLSQHNYLGGNRLLLREEVDIARTDEERRSESRSKYRDAGGTLHESAKMQAHR
jgi:hypothetical protein